MKRYLEIFVKARFATYLLDMQAHVVVFHILICRGFALQDFAF